MFQHSLYYIVQSSTSSVQLKLDLPVGFGPFLGRRRRPYIVFRFRFLYGFMIVYMY